MTRWSGARILAVTNRKGGTGKTTTAVNLAAEFAGAGEAVLLVDLDTQGHAGIGVGVPPAPNRAGVHDLFVDPGASLAETIIPTAVDNLWLAPAKTDFDGAVISRNDQLLAWQLRTHGQRFAWVVIDTPPTLDLALANGICAAQAVMVPFVPHHLAVPAVEQLATLLYRTASRNNPGLRLLGLLPVMLDRHLRLHRRVLATLALRFGSHRILRGIRSNITLAEAFEAGRPVRLFAPRSRGALDYHMLAEEVRAFWPDPRNSFGGRYENRHAR